MAHSSAVVAPITCNSPRAKEGFNRLAASMEESAPAGKGKTCERGLFVANRKGDMTHMTLKTRVTYSKTRVT